MEKIKLFCIPHAGASAYYYLPLKKYLQDVELELVELKGRGRRFEEAPYLSFAEAVEDIYQMVKGKCLGEYGIFGHSMGSWLAYELYFKLQDQADLPKCMFFSGREAPCVQMEKTDFDDFTDTELEAYIRGMGGIDELQSVHSDIKKLFYRIIKADFNLLNDYTFCHEEEKIKSRSVIMAGSQEENLSYKRLVPWEQLAADKVTYVSFQGGHFYMNHQWEKLADVLADHLHRA